MIDSMSELTMLETELYDEIEEMRKALWRAKQSLETGHFTDALWTLNSALGISHVDH